MANNGTQVSSIPVIQRWGATEDPDKIVQEYLTERSLRWKLLTADRSSRGALYAAAYEEVLRRSYADIPNRQSEMARDHAQATFSALRRYVKPGRHVVELGPGSGRVSFLLCSIADHVTMVDVRSTLAAGMGDFPNLSLMVTDGTGARLPKASIDIAFADQLIEHLHPEDALGVHTDIFNALVPGGLLICYTPNRVLGPHDLARYFDEDKPNGLHLVEYSLAELVQLFRKIGFRRIQPLIGGRSIWIPAPLFLLTALERLLDKLPGRLRVRLARLPLLKHVLKILLGARVVARKPSG
ncbi:MAG TPA: class I SAM-dependent methyltransferase [Caulobacteraceae bacterium]|jgi:SAM-dependent methyltransferase|nr:class I SAM-dependent methyltransferase [Caulobacteraceae bacterium]